MTHNVNRALAWLYQCTYTGTSKYWTRQTTVMKALTCTCMYMYMHIQCTTQNCTQFQASMIKYPFFWQTTCYCTVTNIPCDYLNFSHMHTEHNTCFPILFIVHCTNTYISLYSCRADTDIEIFTRLKARRSRGRVFWYVGTSDVSDQSGTLRLTNGQPLGIVIGYMLLLSASVQ